MFKEYKSFLLDNFSFVIINKKNPLDNFIKKIIKKKYIISFINPHSFIISKTNKIFEKSLRLSKNFIDGIGILIIFKLFLKQRIYRVTGYIFSIHLLKQINKQKVFFLGSTDDILKKIKINVMSINPSIKIEYYSPPFTNSFSLKENNKILNKINKFEPDIIFVGMTAPKQEIWSCENYNLVKKCLIVNVGMVFNYLSMDQQKQNNIILYSKIGFEWLYRLIISPYRIWNRVFISAPKFLFSVFIKYINKYFFIKIRIVKNFDKFLNKKSYCLAGFNLAAYSFLSNKIQSKFYFWPDGIFSKLFSSEVVKLPGYELINKIKFIENLENIIVIGNLSRNGKIFLAGNFNCKVIHFKLPYGNIYSIIKYFIKKIELNYKNCIVLLTLPTPKQEILAQAIYKKNKIKIICIGGGLRIACKDELKCPNFLLNLGLEFVWRLRYETQRRIIRILLSICRALFLLIILKTLRTKFINSFK
jgi:N-acetylglucosaminyldiphosphoundecaprenol N-acetyl-beta-D-mannosaminyltransferase